MKGLTVRWSLAGLPDDVAAQLRDYVAEASYVKFSGMEGLGFKTWRMRAGEWFEGTYVFGSDEARTQFQATFAAGADQAPISVMTGAGPVLIEAYEVVAVAEGADGFTPSPATDRG